jgi:hypothetical protein
MSNDEKYKENKLSKDEVIDLLSVKLFDITNDPFETRMRKDSDGSILRIYVEGDSSKTVRKKIPPRFHGFTTIIYNVPDGFIHEKFYRGRE